LSAVHIHKIAAKIVNKKQSCVREENIAHWHACCELPCMFQRSVAVTADHSEQFCNWLKNCVILFFLLS